METWQEIKARHKREKIELVQSFASHYTIKDAAKILRCDERVLRRFAHHSNITFLKAKWPNKMEETE